MFLCLLEQEYDDIGDAETGRSYTNHTTAINLQLHSISHSLKIRQLTCTICTHLHYGREGVTLCLTGRFFLECIITQLLQK